MDEVVFAPFAQLPRPELYAAGPSAAVLRDAYVAVDGALAVETKLMSERLDGPLAQRRQSAFLLALFAVIALVLAMVGVYGVVSYGVTQRMHDLTVRAVLGARPAQLYGLVVGHGLKLAAAGIVVGLATAWALSRLVVGLLFETSPLDPATLLAVAALLAAVAALASWMPARRAVRADPMSVLRAE
jgi:putative ABC transport system permease protein